MIPKIRFNNVADGEQIAKSAGCIYNPAADIVIARYDADGDCMGGVIYRDYTGQGGSVTLHYAGFHPRWFSRDMLYICFDYPFNQLGVKKIFGQVPAFNETAIKVNLHMGFRPDKIIKDVYPEGDMLLVSMYRDQCKYLSMIPSYMKEAPDGR